jgi:hypothetical protein
VRLAGIIVIAFLTGCSATGVKVRPMTAPSGGPGFAISCNASPAACYNAAAQACTGKYRIEDSSQHQVMADVVRYTVVVSCEKP